MTIPEVQYARSGDVAIAYMLIGEGDADLIFMRGLTGDLVSTWEQPRLVRHIEGLAGLGRVIMLDRRGTGLSDRPRDVPTIETSMDDIRAVMDAADSERAVIWTAQTATAVSVMFAATYPERCAGLVLYDPRARGTKADDYPWAPDAKKRREQLTRIGLRWGERAYMEDLAYEWAPEVADDDEFREWFVWHLRRSMSPAAARTAFRFNTELDIRDVLGTVRVPTLIFPRPTEPGPARYVADRIMTSQIVELPPVQGVYTWVDPDVREASLEATRRFMEELADPVEPERVLATLLFTDIVGSTQHLARMGDTAWSALLGRHNAVVRRAIARFGGREVETTGDGFFVSFDGPSRAVRAALAIREAVADLGLEIRSGLHIGECEIADGKLSGMAVHVAARVSALARPGEVLVTGAVRDLAAGADIEFTDRGTHELKGIPDEWTLYAVSG